jgi:hypothetical protein
MAGALSSERPVEGAHTTAAKGTWDEPTKDFLGVYRGKSKTRTEPKGGAVTTGALSRPMMSAPTSNIRKRLRKS